jgi:hypothetical protein
MLEKSRAEEIELAARHASGDLPEAAYVVRVID